MNRVLVSDIVPTGHCIMAIDMDTKRVKIGIYSTSSHAAILAKPLYVQSDPTIVEGIDTMQLLALYENADGSVTSPKEVVDNFEEVLFEGTNFDENNMGAIEVLIDEHLVEYVAFIYNSTLGR